MSATAPQERLGDLFLKVFGPARGGDLDLLLREPHEPVDLAEPPSDGQNFSQASPYKPAS